MGIAEKPIRPEAVDALLRYGWPGNVRELENLIERVLVLSEGPAVTLEDLPDAVRRDDGWTPGSVREAGARRPQVASASRSTSSSATSSWRRSSRTDFNQTRAARAPRHHPAHPQVPHGQARDRRVRSATAPASAHPQRRDPPAP